MTSLWDLDRDNDFQNRGLIAFAVADVIERTMFLRPS